MRGTDKAFSELSNQKRICKTLAVKTIGSALLNESVTQKQRITFREWSKAHIRKNQILRYAIAILLVVGIGWGSWFFTRDLNPISIITIGRVLQVFNAQKELLWEYSFDFPLSSKRYSETTSELHELKRMVIGDFDCDGENELIFGLSELQQKENGTVYYFESDGTLIWKYHANPNITFGGTDIGTNYSVRFILPAYNSFGTGTKFIIHLVHSLYYPSRLVVVDINGKLNNEFWNAGRISDAFLLTKDSAKVQELVFAGTNNEYGQGIFGVLSIDELWGCSPQAIDRYNPDVECNGSQLKYFRFPHLEKYLNPHKFARDEIRSIWIESDSLINIQMLQSGVRYSFSKDYNFLNYIITDAYFANYSRDNKVQLYQNYTLSEIDSVIRGIEVWKNNTWRRLPSIRD